MTEFHGDAARAVLTDPAFAVPPVPPATAGVAWLRATVVRFSDGPVHERRRALTERILSTIDISRRGGGSHPVDRLAAAMGLAAPVADLVADVAQAYQPDTGDDSLADAAVARLVALFGGVMDESSAARIGILVQAYAATTTLIERTRGRSVAEVLAEDPPVQATRRVALRPTTIDGVAVVAGEIVRVALAGDLAFGAGAHHCPGRSHALALVQQARHGGRVLTADVLETG